MLKTVNLQRFADIAELFSQKDVLDYTRNREYPVLLGDSLFPARKTQSLELDELTAGARTPIIASLSAFDAEAEIGSREASKLSLELAYIKRKLQIKEKDLIALQNPRTPEEQKYVQGRVYNDIDVLVQGVLARVEKMTMDVLSSGKIIDKDLDISLDYQVPSEHQATLTASKTWDNDGVDILANLTSWCDSLDIAPTRALTSKKIYRLITTNAKVLQAIFGTSTRALSQTEFDAFMQSQGLPVIRTYDNKYKEQGKDGKYTSQRYFPENRIVLMNDDLLGEKIFGPTPEEISLSGDSSVKTSQFGNVFATIYKASVDPVGVWEKAAATALPGFAAADEVFQAQVLA
ncbi:major capsid protein [Oenococcus oeni]|uniref:Prophage major head protein n=2 Tax=root TaxID=1 RepID=V5US24_9CAUD|nr:major capsid protein [Oenococcus oeni]YP_009006573.1 major capsid protein [Oenococcus phage phiS11]AHB80332.1 prophage major head protein [Oenococcus phage phiS11]KGH52426.1 head protein [Oenococcus oeni S11]MDS0175968.1 major capsid protein [Oenococcus oeni]OIK55990.1 major capsid protein E [Oenococcus oeni]OIM37117.1 major capsid protein E [Oenococcus oeni]